MYLNLRISFISYITDVASILWRIAVILYLQMLYLSQIDFLRLLLFTFTINQVFTSLVEKKENQ